MTQYRAIYPSYLFKTHDPVLDQLDTLIQDSDLSHTRIAATSGVSTTTLSNWRKRKTKRPQFCTIVAVARALGADVQLTANNKVVRLKDRKRA